MNEPIMIEPDGPQRAAFARWCLAQNPPIQVASASGSLVPVELYPRVPEEVLQGAYVDGYLYRGEQAPSPAQQAAIDPVTGLDGAPVGEEAPAEGVPVRRPRKRAATRKAGGK